MNDETKSRFRNSKGKLDTYSLAEQLLIDYHVIRIKCDNARRQEMLYIYTNGIYEHNMPALENAIRRYGRGAKLAEIKTTLKDLSSMIVDDSIRAATNYEYVAFNNCIVNIKTLETFDFDPDRFVITSKVYADYDVPSDDDTVQLVNKFFNDISCGNADIQELLFQIIGYCMLRSAKYQRAFILSGNANNAKSDYMYIITKLLGNYCSSKNLFQLSNLNNLRSIYECTANVIDDVDDVSRVDFSKIRTLISGNAKIAIQCNDEGEFAFEPYATLVLGNNCILDFSGCGDEIFRRFVVVPFEAKFTKQTVDRNMTELITAPACLNVIATKAIHAVSKLGKEWEFPASVENATNSYFFEGNPILAFGKTHPIKRIVTVDWYYRQYATWYTEIFGEHDYVSVSVFGKRLNALLGIKSKTHEVHGDTDTFYEGLDFNFELFRQEYYEFCQSTDGQAHTSFSDYVNHMYKLDTQQNNSDE